MQEFLYFCVVKRSILYIWFIFLAPFLAAEESFNFHLSTFNLDEVILDIYNAVSEFGEADFEQIQTDLYALHENPINLSRSTISFCTPINIRLRVCMN